MRPIFLLWLLLPVLVRGKYCVPTSGCSPLPSDFPANDCTEVSLKHSSCRGQDVKRLAQQMANSKANSLDLSGNDLGDDGAIAAASILEKTPTLTKLMLSSTHIMDHGAARLAQALQRSKLVELDLSRNLVESNGIRKLIDGVKEQVGREGTLLKVNIGQQTNPEDHSSLIKEMNLVLAQRMDCQTTDWRPEGLCVNNKQKFWRTVLKKARGGGSCPHLSESRHCGVQRTPPESQPAAWRPAASQPAASQSESSLKERLTTAFEQNNGVFLYVIAFVLLGFYLHQGRVKCAEDRARREWEQFTRSCLDGSSSKKDVLGFFNEVVRSQSKSTHVQKSRRFFPAEHLNNPNTNDKIELSDEACVLIGAPPNSWYDENEFKNGVEDLIKRSKNRGRFGFSTEEEAHLQQVCGTETKPTVLKEAKRERPADDRETKAPRSSKKAKQK